jgi:hypothetical protein
MIRLCLGGHPEFQISKVRQGKFIGQDAQFEAVDELVPDGIRGVFLFIERQDVFWRDVGLEQMRRGQNVAAAAP